MKSPDLFDAADAAPLGHILGLAPLLAVAGMLAGALTHTFSLSVTGNIFATVLMTSILGVSVAGMYAVKQRQNATLCPWFGVVLIVLTVMVVAFGVGVREELRQTGPFAVAAAKSSLVAVTGQVVTEPRPVAGRWLTFVRVVDLDGRPVRQRVAVLHAGPPPALGFGASFRGVPRSLSDTGFHRWLAQQHAAVVFEPQTVAFDPSQQGLLARASETVRERTRTAAHRFAPPDTAGLMVALVTGDRRGITASDSEAMRSAGMSHLTAVSGMHLGVFSAGVLLLLAASGLPQPARRIVLAVALVWFAFVTRFQPSVLRAGVMALVLLYGGWRGRVGDARHALSVTVLLVLAVDPRLAASVGLQLSASATAGVLVLAPLVRRRLPRQLPQKVRDVIAVTSGAQLAVMPLLLGTFGGVSLAAFPANISASLFAVTAAMFGFVGAVGALIHPLIGSVVFYVATPFAAVVLAIARFFARLPVIINAQMLLLVLVGVGVLIALVRFHPWLRRRWAHIAVVVVVAALLAMAFTTPVRTTGVGDRLLLTVIDVGQGDAWLVEHGQVRILVDTGTDDTAARWLARNGRRTVDLLVLTHPHLDHIGGAQAVLNRIRIGQVWMMTYDNDGPVAAGVRATARQHGVLLHEPPVFQTVALGGLQISVLNPPANRTYRGTNSEWNNESIVLRIGSLEGTLLLMGDTEAPAHQMLLTSGFDLSADVFAVPHHGSATTDVALFAAVGAHTAVVSVGGDNPYGHPHREIVAALEALGTRIVRTDESGTVTMLVAPAQVLAHGLPIGAEGVQDERRLRRTVRRVRPGPDRPGRSGTHAARLRPARRSTAARVAPRGAGGGEPASRQHCRVRS